MYSEESDRQSDLDIFGNREDPIEIHFPERVRHVRKLLHEKKALLLKQMEINNQIAADISALDNDGKKRQKKQGKNMADISGLRHLHKGLVSDVFNIENELKKNVEGYISKNDKRKEKRDLHSKVVYDLLESATSRIDVAKGEPIYYKNKAFITLLQHTLSDFKLKKELSSYKYFILFISFDANNLNELETFNLDKDETSDILKFFNSELKLENANLLTSNEKSLDKVLVQLNRRLSPSSNRQASDFKKINEGRGSGEEENEPTYEELRKKFIENTEFLEMEDIGENEFVPIVVYFKIAFQFEHEELDTIIKWLEDNYNHRYPHIKFIFIFKIVNSQLYVSPNPKCLVTMKKYSGDTSVLKGFLFALIKEGEYPFISPETLELFSNEYELHRPSIEDACEKVYKHCVLQLFLNFDHIVKERDVMDNDNKFQLKKFMMVKGIHFFVDIYNDLMNSSFHENARYVVNMIINIERSQNEDFKNKRNALSKFFGIHILTRQGDVDWTLEIVSKIEGHVRKHEEDNDCQELKSIFTSLRSDFERNVENIMNGEFEDDMRLESNKIKDNHDRKKAIFLQPETNIIGKQTGLSNTVKTEKLADAIFDVLFGIYKECIGSFYRYVSSNFRSIYICNPIELENYVNPDFMGNYMIDLVSHSSERNYFNIGMNILFSILSKEGLKVESDNIYNQFLVNLADMPEKLKQQLFYYCLYAFKYTGLVGDGGYRKSYVIQKNFFSKASFANKIDKKRSRMI